MTLVTLKRRSHRCNQGGPRETRPVFEPLATAKTCSAAAHPVARPRGLKTGLVSLGRARLQACERCSSVPDVLTGWHEWTQRLGHHHACLRLVVLQDGADDPGDGAHGRIQHVHILRLPRQV